MKILTPLFTCSALLAGSAALAQAAAFSGQDAASNQIEALEETINDSNKREVPKFGNSGRTLGWSGNVSARATASSGNTKSTDVGIGARFENFDGVNGHKFNVSLSYGEAAGTRSKNSRILGYDYTREFGSQFYVYGQAQTAYDEFGSYKSDNFLGLGVGYRAVSTDTTQWSLQAGPGYRKAELKNGTDVKEAAWSLASYYSQDLTDTTSLFNDTQVLGSKADTFVTNELGVSVAMSDSLALRTSLLTKHHTKPVTGNKKTDNTLGVSIVYNLK